MGTIRYPIKGGGAFCDNVFFVGTIYIYYLFFSAPSLQMGTLPDPGNLATVPNLNVSNCKSLKSTGYCNATSFIIINFFFANNCPYT